jgi:hypothetical protein
MDSYPKVGSNVHRDDFMLHQEGRERLIIHIMRFSVDSWAVCPKCAPENWKRKLARGFYYDEGLGQGPHSLNFPPVPAFLICLPRWGQKVKKEERALKSVSKY